MNMGALWSLEDEVSAQGASKSKCRINLEDEASAERISKMKRITTWHVLSELKPSLLSKLVLHRGYHDRRDVVTKRPLENTLKAFTIGWEMGVRHSECDITVTKDGKVILAHDETLERVSLNSPRTLKNPISRASLSDLTYNEIREVRLKDGSQVPLLEDVLTSAIACNGKLVVELKSTGNWQRLVEHTVALFASKPHLFDAVGVFMSFNHLLIKRLKLEMEKLKVVLPPCLGLTDTDLWPGFEDIIWSIEADDSLAAANKFVEDFNLDGLYVKYEHHFEDVSQQKKLRQLLGDCILGIWNAPDTVADLQFWADFGFHFVNTDLATHFTRTNYPSGETNM